MNLEEVFNTLATHELSLSREANAESTQIQAAHLNRVLLTVNNGLGALYRQFNLKTKIKEITFIDGVRAYNVDEDKDVIEITEITDLHGTRIPVREAIHLDETCMLGKFYVRKMSLTNLVFGEDVLGNGAYIKYRCKHPKIMAIDENTNLSSIELELPEAYLDALVYYCAHKLTTARDPQAVMTRSPFHVGNNYKALYETELGKMLMEGNDIEPYIENTRFNMNGFC